MSSKPMFAVGDLVRVKSLDELVIEFGADIDTPCHFVASMQEYCGMKMEVERVFAVDEMHFAYHLIGGEGWNFDECVLDDGIIEEPQLDLDSVSMGYESLF